jgi:hypothetical protein
MHTDQQPYRTLHDDILEYAGDAPYNDLIRPWLLRNDGERRWLGQLRGRGGDPVPPMRPEESWRLYALSRIVQLLQLSFAPRTADPPWTVAPVSGDEYARFIAALGLEAVERAGFHPFFHEVVTVDPLAEEDAPPELAEVCWPACTLGPLLVSRAGCRVRAGRLHLLKEVAERSTLYWAYARNHRPAEDPSRGWGGNSQWRTAFRRDYALDGRLFYNVGAKESPGGVDPELDAGDRAELLRHRCFVRSTKRSDDRWPYDLGLVEEA